MPLNVDNLSKDGFQRTYLNAPKPKDTSLDALTEEEREKLQTVRWPDGTEFIFEKPHRDRQTCEV